MHALRVRWQKLSVSQLASITQAKIHHDNTWHVHHHYAQALQDT